MMFQRILVPLDGSAHAERALPLAARIARASRGSVTLLHVVTHPIDAAAYLMQPPDETEHTLNAGIRRLPIISRPLLVLMSSQVL